MLVQLFLSVKDRKKNMDVTGDAWGLGRTLEWHTSSPAADYNFAVIPEVKEIDDFTRMKEDGTAYRRPEKYYPIVMPKNKPYGPIIGALSIGFGFAMVWHIWWLAVASLIGIIATVIYFGFDDDSVYVIPAEEVKRLEDERFAAISAAAPQLTNNEKEEK